MTTYNWRPAEGKDVDTIFNLAYTQLLDEVDDVFEVDPRVSKHNITLSVVNQYYSPLSELFSVAIDENNNIIAYTMATTSENCLWSTEKLVTIKIAHVDKNLSARMRYKLVNDMLSIWDIFAKLTNASVIVSNSMRKEQDAFLKLHEKNGYLVRGSFAYKKLL